MNALERRMVVGELEIREDANTATLAGCYASTFNDPYDMGWYTEEVDPGAFNRTLGRKPDVRFLINHKDLPLARTTSGTLRLDVDKRGLRPFAELDKSDPDVQRLIPKVKRGDVNQMSFAFRVDGADGDAWSSDMSHRTLRTLDLNDGDVSVVTYPANPNAVFGLRGDGPNIEAIARALAALERRDASEEDIVSVLTRALGYFTAIDLVVDQAQDEIADALGIPNPDMEDALEGGADSEMNSARAQLEARLRLLQV